MQEHISMDMIGYANPSQTTKSSHKNESIISNMQTPDITWFQLEVSMLHNNIA